MTKAASSEDLGRQIEKLVHTHLKASRSEAEAALERAFSAALGVPGKKRQTVARPTAGSRRTRADVLATGERLYEAVCAKPGEPMTTLADRLGASVRELERPMALLKQADRVHGIGERNLMRYFPTA